MASLLPSKQRPPKLNVVPNGGLGGFVHSGEGSLKRIGFVDMSQTEALTPSSKRRRPPPIQVEALAPISASQPSACSSLGFSGLWTPKTPTDRARSRSLLGSDANTPCSLISRYNSAAPSTVCSPPQTPMSSRLLKDSLAVELPGSLLLPSQGFPQTFPISPPPSLHRSDTGDSTVSSLPVLSASSITDEATMETLRHLTYPLRKNDRSGDPTFPSYIDRQSTPEALITKPFTAMSIEELLNCLPNLNTTTVSESWLPAMRAQLNSVTSLLQEASELKLDSNLKQITLEDDFKSFSDEFRIITTTYRNLVQSAESLVERDTKASADRLRELEVQVEEALEKMQGKDNKITDQNLKIKQLRQTILDIVRILGAFIQANVPNWPELAQRPRTRDVFRIFSDYSRDGDSASIRFVRIPEVTVDNYAADLREAKNLVGEYQKVLQSQSETIQEQSRDLDANVQKYESFVERMKERDHELLLMMQRNEDSTKQLHETEAALAKTERAHGEAIQRYHESTGKMQSLMIAHALELDQRDAEIANLRQKLGSAREEVFARRADFRNIVSQTRTLLTPADPPPTSTKTSSASKALRFLGMGQDKDKMRRQGLPGSRSMVGLSPTNSNFGTSISDSRYSSKEVAPALSKSLPHHTSTRENFLHARTSDLSVDGPGDLILPSTVAIRPRDTLLGATESHGIIAPPMDTHKTLPAAPQLSLSTSTTTRRLAEFTDTETIQSPMAMQIASDYYDGIYGQTAPRRVLSNIPEASVKGSSEAGETSVKEDRKEYDYCESDADSVSSSDREAYRKSIHVLDMLNSRLPPHDTEEGFQGSWRDRESHSEALRYADSQDPAETGIARIMQLRPQARNGDLRAALRRRDSLGFDERKTLANPRASVVSDAAGHRSSDSDLEPKTVSQLYHQKPRHIQG